MFGLFFSLFFFFYFFFFFFFFFVSGVLISKILEGGASGEVRKVR